MSGAGSVYHKEYLRTQGRPYRRCRQGWPGLPKPDIQIKGVGTTGSGAASRAIAGADIVKNEITAHAAAATHFTLMSKL